MTQALYAIAALTVVLFGAALLVVWARRRTWVRGAAIPVAIAAAAAAAAIVLATLGFPVPLISGVTAPTGDYSVLSNKLVLNEGIYLTLDLPGGPKLFWLPWSKTMAEMLQEMSEDPGNAGVTATIPPFEWSWDLSDPSFQPLPQPKWMDDKPLEAAPAPAVPSFAA